MTVSLPREYNCLAVIQSPYMLLSETHCLRVNVSWVKVHSIQEKDNQPDSRLYINDTLNQYEYYLVEDKLTIVEYQWPTDKAVVSITAWGRYSRVTIYDITLQKGFCQTQGKHTE